MHSDNARAHGLLRTERRICQGREGRYEIGVTALQRIDLPEFARERDELALRRRPRDQRASRRNDVGNRRREGARGCEEAEAPVFKGGAGDGA